MHSVALSSQGVAESWPERARGRAASVESWVRGPMNAAAGGTTGCGKRPGKRWRAAGPLVTRKFVWARRDCREPTQPRVSVVLLGCPVILRSSVSPCGLGATGEPDGLAGPGDLQASQVDREGSAPGPGGGRNRPRVMRGSGKDEWWRRSMVHRRPRTRSCPPRGAVPL